MAKRALVVLLIVAAVVGAAAALLYSGVYSVAANSRDPWLVSSILDFAKDRSIVRHASAVQAPKLPAKGDNQEGFGHYDEMCVACHGAPGIEDSEIGSALNPPAPDLGEEAGELTPSEIFWIIKHGIKMTGMPAFGKTHSDDKLWAITAFVKQLPNISPADYERMRSASEQSLHRPMEEADHAEHRRP